MSNYFSIEFVTITTINEHWRDLMLTYFEEVLQDMGMKHEVGIIRIAA